MSIASSMKPGRPVQEQQRPLKKILVCCDWYEPGFKAGGPIRSCVNFVNQMKDDYQIYVLTGDRDLDEQAPYEGIGADQWNSIHPNVKIYYCSPGNLTWKHIRNQIQAVSPDYIYLNSMYSRYFTIYPLLQSRLGAFKSKMVLAPRGMLRQSAIQFKKGKKQLFLALFKTIGLHKRIQFHATDEDEVNEIQNNFGSSASTAMIPNFPGFLPDYQGSVLKEAGLLKMIFVGRLHKIKNLDWLLQQLEVVKGKILLTVVGGEEDAAYVQECKQRASALPASIEVDFRGAVANHKLPALIADHHLFVLPTQGENFGHAIFEALRAGRPVLISDQTPWRGLHAFKAGWDLPLSGAGFKEKIQEAVNFNQQEYDQWSAGSWNFVHQYVSSSDLKTAYIKLFS
jgi:glycosyltransferase involved in cell wall biosynthesis